MTGQEQRAKDSGEAGLIWTGSKGIRFGKVTAGMSDTGIPACMQMKFKQHYGRNLVEI